MEDPAGVDATTSAVVMCKYADPALRLCVEFADGNYSNATDGSAYQLNPITEEIGAATRDGQNAAGTYWESKLEVAENPMLDITPAITFETFMRVPSLAGYHNARLIYNQGQYELALDSDGRVTCRIGALAARSDTAIGRDVWRHVACAYDGQELSVWVDGSAAKCQTGTVAIATTGTNGTRLVGPFTGYVDDMRVFARKLTPAEICSHADKTACASACI